MAQWVQKASCPYGSFIPNFYFALGTKIYVAKKDSVITWDQTTNTWSFFGMFPGQIRSTAAIAHTNGKAYVISGSIVGGYTSEVWEFDPVTGWTQKGNFPGAGRASHSLVSHFGNNYIYLSFGANGSNSYLSDFWQYDPATDTWTQKASGATLGGARNRHISYIDANGNVVVKYGDMGPNNFATVSPVIYSVATNSWISGGGTPIGAKRSASIFTIGNNAYVGLGILGGSPPYLAYSSFSREALTTAAIASFPGTLSANNLAVGCNGKGYIGLGDAEGNGYPPFPFLNQLWEYSVPQTITASSGTICSGSSVTLTAGGSSNYTWNPGGATGSVTIVSPTATTIYTLSGATAQTTKTITVLPILPLTVAAASSLICPGDTVSLFVSGGTTYTWTPGNSTGSVIVVSPTISTNYAVSSASCAHGAITVSVIAIPAVSISVAGSSSICAGQSITLNGAAGYSWQPGNYSGQNYTVNPTASTIYTASASGPGGMCMQSETVEVNVSQAMPFTVSVLPSATLCTAQIPTLNVTGPYTNYNCNTISFNSPSLALPSGSTATSNYTISADNNTCGTSSIITIFVGSAPVFSIITANSLCDSCNGSIAVIASGNLTSYHFNFSPTVNCISLPCTNLCPNLYHVTLSDSAGCSSNKFFSIACSGYKNGGSTGIAALTADDQQLMIYPNPAASQITLQSTTPTFEYRISNCLGQVIITGSCGEEKTVVSLEGLSKGVYFVEAQSNGKTLRKKLILE